MRWNKMDLRSGVSTRGLGQRKGGGGKRRVVRVRLEKRVVWSMRKV